MKKMRWWNNIMENVKNNVRSWLNIEPATTVSINITEALDFAGNAMKNRIWYRGDGTELEQLYSQLVTNSARKSFWAAKCSPGMEINKIHTGLPSLIVDTLSNVVLTGLNDYDFKNQTDRDIWSKIDDENKIKDKIEEAIKKVLYIGDGAFKVTFDSSMSDYPIIEFYPGDNVEFIMKRGRIHEVEFRTEYEYRKKKYILHEFYGYGYIKYVMTHDGKEVPLDGIPQTRALKNVAFSTYSEEKGEMSKKGEYMLAVPVKFFSSSKWEGRGQSVYDKKIDAFDSFDEIWSQWMDALRAGRSKEYIPEGLIPRNPEDGMLLKPNAFDNRFIKINDDMAENAKNEISLKQPNIPHESYLATYITALDLCLQGLISPSTLGIDVKKLDNADAQREKEKATLYTRDAIVDALIEDLKKLIQVSIMSYREFATPGTEKQDVEVDVSFAEYANPSFESQIETVGKGKTQGIMSIEACVDELYGDTKDKEWKKAEVARLKAEQGIADVEEPGVNMASGNFNVNLEGGQNASKGNEPTLPNE